MRLISFFLAVPGNAEQRGRLQVGTRRWSLAHVVSPDQQ